MKEAPSQSPGASSSDSIQRRLEFEKTVSAISTRFIGDFSLEDAIESSLADMGSLRDADRAYLFLFKEDGDALENIHEWCARDIASQKEELRKIPLTFFSLWMDRLKRGEAVHLQSPSRMPENSESERELMRSSGINSLLIFPIRLEDELSGFIGFESSKRAVGWTDDDVEILKVASDVIGRGIQQKRQQHELESNRRHLEQLVAHESSLTRDLQKQMQRLTVLYEVTRALNFIDDLDKLLVVILDGAREIADSEKGSIMLHDEKTDELVVRVVRGIDEETEEKISSGEIQCTRIKSGEGIAGRVFAEGKPLVIEKAQKDLRFKESSVSRVANILCVPLIVHQQSIGVINITNKKSGASFSEEDLTVAMALATHAAIAINNSRLYEKAVICSLTGTMMRQHFMQRLEEELNRCRRYAHALSLVMIDLDHFKDINEIFGHQAGDRVLAALGRVLKKGLRCCDFIGRYGGDEFAVVLTETGEEGAMVVCRRLGKSVEDLRIGVEPFEIKITLSMGIASWPAQGENPQDLIRFADLTLSKAKRDGRNRVYHFSDLKSSRSDPS